MDDTQRTEAGAEMEEATEEWLTRPSSGLRRWAAGSLSRTPGSRIKADTQRVCLEERCSEPRHGRAKFCTHHRQIYNVIMRHYHKKTYYIRPSVSHVASIMSVRSDAAVMEEGEESAYIYSSEIDADVDA